MIFIKNIVNLLKKIIFGFLILYGFNLIGSNFNITIPINVITILVVSALGIPALAALVVIFVFVY